MLIIYRNFVFGPDDPGPVIPTERAKQQAKKLENIFGHHMSSAKPQKHVQFSDPFN